jgi:thiol-disulfide isomerase/thioredoxin
MDLSGRERDKLFLSRGGQGFCDASYFSGADGPEDARAFAHADLDRDGHEDLIVVSRNAPLLRIYHNAIGPARGGDFLGLVLEGRGDAVGARVRARCGGLTQTREVARGEGFAVQGSAVITLGFAHCPKVEQLSVRFRGGEERNFRDVRTGGFYRLVEGKGLKEVPNVYGPRAPSVAAAAPSVAAAPSSPGSPAEVLAAAARSLAPGDGPLLLAYWATWCEACRRELPRLDALAATLGSRAEVIGPSLEPKDDAAAVARYVSERHPQHRLLAWDAQLAHATEALFGATPPLPSVVLLDRKSGRVLYRGAGVPTRSQLERVLSP